MKHKTSLEDCMEFIAGDKTVLREILHPAKHDVKLRYSLAHFKILAGHKSARHSLKSSEIYFIISGHGRMHIGNEVFDVTGGDTVYIPPNSVQSIENLSKTEPIVALCVVDPAWRKEDETVYEQ